MPELPKIHDVGFVGAKYGIREKIVLALRGAGVSVTAYGNGWEEGRLAPESTPKFFAQCKIVLGVGTVGHCTDFYALKMRDFDAPMSGSFYLTHDNPDLNSVYAVGREIVTYRTAQQCVEKARYYLAHETERETIAQAGWRRAAAEHTWQHRFATLLMELRS
jgi:hypothetical protein